MASMQERLEAAAKMRSEVKELLISMGYPMSARAADLVGEHDPLGEIGISGQVVIDHLLKGEADEARDLLIKCLGREEKIEPIIRTLCDNMIHGSKKLRDISRAILKKLIELPYKIPVICENVVEILTELAEERNDILMTLKKLSSADIPSDLHGQIVDQASSPFESIEETLLLLLLESERFDDHIERIMPCIVGLSDHSEDRLKERCVQKFATFLQKAPKESVARYRAKIVQVCLKCIRRDTTVDSEENEEHERSIKTRALSYSLLKQLEEASPGCLEKHLNEIVLGSLYSLNKNKHKASRLIESSTFIIWLLQRYKQALHGSSLTELLVPVTIGCAKSWAEKYEALKLELEQTKAQADKSLIERGSMGQSSIAQSSMGEAKCQEGNERVREEELYLNASERQKELLAKKEKLRKIRELNEAKEAQVNKSSMGQSSGGQALVMTPGMANVIQRAREKHAQKMNRQRMFDH